MIHGLAGCARAPYLVRVAKLLARGGVRVIRMNLRGAGAGHGGARETYHAGRTDDLRRVARWLARRAPGSPIALVGFSLGANLVLKLAAEAADHPLESLDAVVAANPPLDLAACCRHIRLRENRVYDRHFVRMLRREVSKLHRAYPELGTVDLGRVGSLLEFDGLYTAARNGFENADDYYQQSSAGPMIPRITIPGLVVHAADDPFIPVEPFYRICFPPNIQFELLPYGGHLGYLGRNLWRGECRWLDSRLVAWLASHWSMPGRDVAAIINHPERTRSSEASWRPELSCMTNTLTNTAPRSRSSNAGARFWSRIWPTRSWSGRTTFPTEASS
jgi:hypothetical protein